MNSEPERLYRITKRTAALFITGAAIVLALNLILVWRNRHLANEAAELQRALEPSPGTLVPPLSGVDADGMAFSLPHGKDAKNTLLLVFSPGCRVCDENWPLWQDIDRSVNRDRFQVVFVDLSGQVTRDYILAHQIGEFPVISKLDPKELIE